MFDPSRMDSHATHTHDAFRLRAGRPLPFGASRVPGGVNFSIFSRHAESCTLVLFDKHEGEPRAEIPMLEEFRVGDVFTMVVFDIDYENLEYGFRLDGPWDPREGHRFDTDTILLDPYARAIGGREVWGEPPAQAEVYPYRAQVALDDFDWRDERTVPTPAEDLVIYEMHVRGFTRHDSSGCNHPGTFAGLAEKIDYLTELGVNAVELMPIFEFDEFDNRHINPETGERLKNYWGYNTIGFFAPKAGYAASGRFSMQVDELKNTVRKLHVAGIEVLLDVVYNHTAEGDRHGPTISYRGVDNKTYYILDDNGDYLNFSGTGNTLNCNNPIVRNHVLDSLRHWAAEYHIDGFRFDLASILGRDPEGEPLENPPLLEALAYDPILANCKLIAEAWDAGGLYQVGNFPSYERRWGEWNGRYRDALRRFLRGDMGMAEEMSRRVAGSPDLYSKRGPAASVNFVTCHDGFPLADLVSYEHKHNRANGEQGRDGSNDNLSANYGVEGPTDDPEILALRRRQMKNALAILMVSQGVPMIVMGDEVGRSQGGNNNAYCHDAPWNWLDWGLRQDNPGHFRFARNIIAFRHAHPALRSPEHLTGRDVLGTGYPDLSWHGVEAWEPDFAPWSRTLAFMLCGDHAKVGMAKDDMIYVAMNMHWEPHTFELPKLTAERAWRRACDTALPSPDDILPPGEEVALESQDAYDVGPRSVVIMVGGVP